MVHGITKVAAIELFRSHRFSQPRRTTHHFLDMLTASIFPIAHIGSTFSKATKFGLAKHPVVHYAIWANGINTGKIFVTFKTVFIYFWIFEIAAQSLAHFYTHTNNIKNSRQVIIYDDPPFFTFDFFTPGWPGIMNLLIYLT